MSSPEPGPEVNLVVSRLNVVRFALLHVLCVGALWTGVDATAVALFVGSYVLRMFAVTAGYHRYFSHRAFKTSRPVAFALGFLAQASCQKSLLWWAAHHRHHHRHADQAEDVHTPSRGFWWSHVGWVLSPHTEDTDMARVRDLARVPELRWLHRFQYTPAVVLGLACLAIGGWSGWMFGFLWSTIAVFHATFTINSLSHMVGGRRYDTPDTSRNNLALALLTMGEGWHNNHHHFPVSARQGFAWWEVDLTWYGLWMMERVGLIWDVKRPPARVLAGVAAPGGAP